MNSRIAAVLAVFAAMLCVLPVSVVLFEDSEAASSDVEWRDPPSADYVIEITQDLTFKSNDPEYSLRILSQDLVVTDDVFGAVSDDSQDDMAEFVKRVRNIGTSGVHTVVDDATSDGWTDACVPSWINATIVDDDGVYGEQHEGIIITIMPALQQVSEDTHGDYWIYYSMTQSGPGITTNTKTYLFTFSVDVEWAGGVIVPDTYNRFVVNWDYGNGYVVSTTPVTVASNVTSLSFPIPSDAPSRDGKVFVGFSASRDGSVIDAASVVVHTGDSNVVAVEDGSGGMVYTATFYAVWETQGLVIPTFWDGLIELFSDPMVLLFMAVMFLAVCLFIRNRNGGRYRWSPFSPLSVRSSRSSGSVSIGTILPS